MKTKTIMKQKSKLLVLVALSLFSFSAKAQWIVNDPVNIATSITNTVKEIVQTSKTVKNTLENFKEVEKVYSQGKKFYDGLKKVNNLVKDARKVQQTILMIGEISDIYVNSYRQMLRDENFTFEELTAIAYGYTKLLDESTELLKELRNIVNVTSLSMNDKERMDMVTQIHDKVSEYRNLVSYYTSKNISISYLRAKKRDNTANFTALYGTANERYW